MSLQVVFVLNADDSGRIQTPVPGTPEGPPLTRSIDWVLLDGMAVRQKREIREKERDKGMRPDSCYSCLVLYCCAVMACHDPVCAAIFVAGWLWEDV